MSEEMDLAAISYCAGLFEGEGSIHCVVRNVGNAKQRQLILQIAMCDLEPLERFQEFIGVGSINGPYKHKNSNWTDFYRYVASSFSDVQHVMYLIYDWLSPRRQFQFDEAFVKYKAWETEHAQTALRIVS